MATNKRVQAGFHAKGVTLELDQILPTKQVPESVAASVKYRRIAASISEVGIIEPPIVYPQNGSASEPKQYLLLDGHLRLRVLRDLETSSVFCLVAKEDEGYTYNRHVNRLSSIQEHFMIMKALENGVPEQRLAKAFNVELATLYKKRNLLRGVCDEAVGILKDVDIAAASLAFLKKVKPVRQIEMAELMQAARNFSTAYSRALFLATPNAQLTAASKRKVVNDLSPQEMARIEREMQAVEVDIKAVEASHGNNVLNLVLTRGYLVKLLGNAQVVRFLSSNYHDLLEQFQNIVELEGLQE